MRIAKSEPFYQISQASKLLNITSDRLRTYEEEGLIKPYRATHTKDGKRLFSQDEIDWLEMIRDLIKLGVTIPVIRVILSSDIKFGELNYEKDKEICEIFKKLFCHAVYSKLYN